MNRIQTLLAIALCTVLISSFNTPNNKPADATGPTRNKYVKPKSAWSNPWSKESRFAPKAVDVQVDWFHECKTPSLVYKYRLFVGSNEYQACGLPIGVSTYYAPPGSRVSIEIEVPVIWGAYYINIDDYDNMGGSQNIFYADSPAYNTFYFELTAGHYYYVYTQTY